MILPYCEIDGILTLRDSDVHELYNDMCAEETANVVFYDGSIRNEDQFLQYFRSKSADLYVISNSDKHTVALGWLNTFDQRTAQVHYVGFKKHFNRESLKLGREFVQQILRMGYVTLTGIIPDTNPAACRMAEALGFTKLGTIPDHCYLYHEDRMVAGNVYYIRSLYEDLQ